MTEWAMIKGGEIINVVTTERKLATLKLDHPGVAFVPLDQVSPAVLQSYRYWTERP